MVKAMVVAGLLMGGLSWMDVACAQKRGMQDVDFGRITCGEFLSDIAGASEDDAAAVMLWLDGYLSGVSGDTVLRWRGLEAFAENLVQRCDRRPRERLLDAARKVGIN